MIHAIHSASGALRAVQNPECPAVRRLCCNCVFVISVCYHYYHHYYCCHYYY